MTVFGDVSSCSPPDGESGGATKKETIERILDGIQHRRENQNSSARLAGEDSSIKHQITPTQFYQWQKIFFENEASAFKSRKFSFLGESEAGSGMLVFLGCVFWNICFPVSKNGYALGQFGC
jgi:hypothetical protein